MTTDGRLHETSWVRRWAILATVLCGTTLAILDSSILNISVVPIMETLQTDLHTVKWVLTSYNLVLAMFMIGFGSLGDTVGRRRLYVLGQLVFVGGSVLAAMAAGPWQLMAFRALQGLGAAALAPNALALIREYFSDRERGVALGLWSTAVGLAWAIGPVVGGIVAQRWGWRALFLMNLPIGLLVALAASAFLVPDVSWRGRRFDIVGFFVLSGTLLALALALTDVPVLNGRWTRLSIVAVASVLGTAFVLMERRTPDPLVELQSVLRLDVMAANTAVFFAVLVMAGGMFLSVLYAQLLTNASPATIGVLVAPCASATLAIAFVAGWLTDKIGLRLPVITGLLMLTASVVVPILWRPLSPAPLVVWSNVIAGTGLGFAMPALIRATTESVGQHRAGMGAGLYKSVNELGGVFGVVLLGTFAEGRIVANALQELPDYLLPRELTFKVITSLTVLEDHALQSGLAPQDLVNFHQILVQAVQQGFVQVFGLAAALAVIGVGAGLMVPRRLGGRPDES